MKMRTLHWILAASLVGGPLLTGCQDAVEDQEASTSIEAPLLGTDAQDKLDDEYIVVFKNTVPKASITSAIDRLRTNHKDAATVGFTYNIIPGFSAKLDARALAELRRDPNVAYITHDSLVTLGANANGQDRVDQDEGRDGAAYNNFGRDGSGVNVYIIDTGVQAGHSEWTGRYTSGRDTVDNDNDAEDCHGHGTHVAGTATGTLYGLANGANLIGVRVLNCGGSGTNAQVIAGIDWVADNAVLPAVANMSLGGGANQGTDDAVNAAVAAGIFFAVAAGNEDSDACTRSPAGAASAYTVGATEDTSDARASFSNWGACVDGFAPGRNITSAWLNNGTNTISGTSMASPHVAGAAAQYLGANPSATPAQVEAALDANNGINCVTSSQTNEDSILHVDFNRGNHDCGGGGPGPDPNSCVDNNACGGQAPGGCMCDSLCWWYGDCCSDGPC